MVGFSIYLRALCLIRPSGPPFGWVSLLFEKPVAHSYRRRLIFVAFMGTAECLYRQTGLSCEGYF
jgi:hypothetical protein